MSCYLSINGFYFLAKLCRLAQSDRGGYCENGIRIYSIVYLVSFGAEMRNYVTIKNYSVPTTKVIASKDAKEFDAMMIFNN